MVIVASIYLRFYIEVGVGVGTLLPTPTPTPLKIPSDSDTTALLSGTRTFFIMIVVRGGKRF
jgi:hypothetical protein